MYLSPAQLYVKALLIYYTASIHLADAFIKAMDG